MSRLFAWPAIVALTGLAVASEPAPWPAPTPEEIRATIQREMETVYLNAMSRSLNHFTAVSIALTEPRVGELAYRNLSYEKALEPVWPVTTIVTVTARRETGTPQVDVRGEGEVWYFYKTETGVWTYRLGS